MQIQVNMEEILDLVEMGINPSAIKFSTLRMPSSKWIIVRDVDGDNLSWVNVETKRKFSQAMKADSLEDVDIHPSLPHLMIRTDSTIQIAEIDDEGSLSPISSTNATVINHASFDSDESMFVITNTHFCKWSYRTEQTPKPIFAISPNIVSGAITGVIKHASWYGVSALNEGLKADIQLYDTSKGSGQEVTGFCPFFYNNRVSIWHDGSIKMAPITEGVAPVVLSLPLTGEIPISASLYGGLMFIFTNKGTIYGVNDTGIISQSKTEFIARAVDNFIVTKSGKVMRMIVPYDQLLNYNLSQKLYQEAAQIVASTPELRSVSTMERFEGYSKEALVSYLSVLLEYTLNEYETVKLVSLLIEQDKLDAVETFIKQDKLTLSYELASMLRNVHEKLATRVFMSLKMHEEVCLTFMKHERYQICLKYAEQIEEDIDWYRVMNDKLCDLLLENGTIQPADAIKHFAKSDLQYATKLLVEHSLFAECALPIFVENLNSGNSEIALKLIKLLFLENDETENTMLAEEFLSNSRTYEFYAGILLLSNDEEEILSTLREKTSALKDTIDTDVLSHALVKIGVESIPSVLLYVLKNFELSEQDLITLVSSLLSGFDLSVVIQPLTQQGYHNIVFSVGLSLIKAGSSLKGMEYFFVEACVSTEQLNVLEEFLRVQPIGDDEVDPIKNFLFKKKLSNHLPLITLCDRYSVYLHDMVNYFYASGRLNIIEAYLAQFQRATDNTDVVFASLLDIGVASNEIQSLLLGLESQFNFEKVVSVFESKNSLKILKPVLENIIASNSIDPTIHTAYLKVLILEGSSKVKELLATNDFYDTRGIGLFSENINPRYSVLCFKKGQHWQEYVDLCVNNSFLKDLAVDAVQEKSILELCLTAGHQDIIDMIINVGIDELSDPDLFSEIVQSFLHLSDPINLIKLLERVILRPTVFSDNEDLQTLLMGYAINNKSDSIMEYVETMDKYNIGKISKLAIKANLFEEAFRMNVRFERYQDALKILLKNIEDYERALEFVQKYNEVEHHKILGAYQIKRGLLIDAVSSFLLINEVDFFNEIVAHIATNSANILELYNEEQCTLIIKYLQAVRHSGIQDQGLYTELVYMLSICNRYLEAEDLLESSSGTIKLDTLGERLFDAKKFDLALRFFNKAGLYHNVALCNLELGNLEAALDAAKQCNNIELVKEILVKALVAGKFSIVKIASHKLISSMEEVDFIIDAFIKANEVDELLSLLESLINLDKVTPALFTRLAILFADYKQEKIIPYLKVNINRVNIHLLKKYFNENGLFKELLFLEQHDKNYDSCIQIMINNKDLYDADQFQLYISNLLNLELMYTALAFIIAEHPEALSGLLRILDSDRLDKKRLISMFEKEGLMSVLVEFLERILQKEDSSLVNETLIAFYLEVSDLVKLTDLATNKNNYDYNKLVKVLLEKDYLQAKLLAGKIYSKQRQFKQALDIYLYDELYVEAIELVYVSDSTTLAKSLLTTLVELKEDEGFVAMLVKCQHLLNVSEVMQLAWEHKLSHLAMPFFIKSINKYEQRMNQLESAVSDMREFMSDIRERERKYSEFVNSKS
ncbi:hypothetical protein PCE1_000651 [Barthelona sp. PCE]